MFNESKRIKRQHLPGVMQPTSMAGEAFVVFEFVLLSLSEVAGHPLMDGMRLASTLGQVKF